MFRSFGHYRLLRLIGEGATASVWLATPDVRGATESNAAACALKIMHADLAGDAAVAEMFANEAKMLGLVGRSDSAVGVFESGTHDGRSFIAMELVDGMTVAELARRHAGPWAVGPAVAVATAVLRALQPLHEHCTAQAPMGSVHRDVTPHNVMVSAEGEVKLIDFGIAQSVGTGRSVADAMGKLGYVPREQIEGDADERSDIFAVGALLFELLDGRRFRWHCADEDALFQEIYRDRVPVLAREDVPRPLRMIVSAMLHPDREQRVGSAAEALEMLEGWSDSEWARSELEGLYLAVTGDDAPTATAELDSVEQSRRSALRRRARVSSASRAANGRYPWHPADSAQPLEASPAAREEQITSASPTWLCASRAPTGDEPLSAEREVTRAVMRDEASPIPHSDHVSEGRTRAWSSPHGHDDSADVPMARRAAEIAVTRPTPSRLAPWSTDAAPEPAAPRRRRRRSTRESTEHVGVPVASVTPRSREGASMHQAASSMRARDPAGEVVRGEIVTEEAVGGPVWRLDPRR